MVLTVQLLKKTNLVEDDQRDRSNKNGRTANQPHHFTKLAGSNFAHVESIDTAQRKQCQIRKPILFTRLKAPARRSLQDAPRPP